MRARKLICYLLSFAGVIALAFSIIYTSLILAFIGLGLVLWGAIFFYISAEIYVKETLLNKTTLPSLANTVSLLSELGYRGKGVYLPPKYLKDLESSKVYISAQEDLKLPSLEKLSNEENSVFFKNPGGALITAPGAELAALFEKTLDTSFAAVDLQYIEQNMPKLLIEDLEIAKNVEIETEKDKVYVKIENSIYKNLCQEARRLGNICDSLGCPLCSAIACAITKATGYPVILQGGQTTEDGQTIYMEYHILQKAEKEKTQ